MDGGGGWVEEINTKDHISPAKAGHWAELGNARIAPIENPSQNHRMPKKVYDRISKIKVYTYLPLFGEKVRSSKYFIHAFPYVWRISVPIKRYSRGSKRI